LGVPDACLMFFDQVLAFDHVKKEILLIVTADLTREKRGQGRVPHPCVSSHGWVGAVPAYARAVKRLDRLEKRLARVLPRPVKSRAGRSDQGWER
jgi:anthranilate synthase component 1